MITRFFSGLICAAALANTAFGALINVPEDQPTIQQAIDIAANGDEIVIAQGTYLEQLNLLGKEITLRSTDPDDPAIVRATIIDGGNDPDLPDFPQNPGSTIRANSGETLNTQLIGLTITGGYADDPTFGGNGTSGGGIQVFQGFVVDGNDVTFFPSTITLDRCRFVKNTAVGAGGGVFIGFGPNPGVINRCEFIENTALSGEGGAVSTRGLTSVTFDTCVFRNNTGIGAASTAPDTSATPGVDTATYIDCVFEDNTGGAISANSLALTVSGSTFRRNIRGDGGAIRITGGSLDVSGSLFEENEAMGDGGAIATASDTTPTLIRGSTFDRNTAIGRGGGVNIFIGEAELDGNTFTSNHADGSGGGAWVSGDRSHIVRNNTFIGNTTNGDGGGLGGSFSTYTVVGNTLTNNQALSGRGGGMYIVFPNRSTVFSGNRFENNTAQNGGGAWARGIDVPPFNSSLLMRWSGNDFINNTAIPFDDPTFGLREGQGGGLYFRDNPFTILHGNRFIGNDAFEGGAFYNRGDSPLPTDITPHFINTLFHANTAELGGAVNGVFSLLDFTNCLFTANDATNGGAVFLDCASRMQFDNATFSENTANNGGAIFANCGFNDEDNVGTFSNTIVHNNDATLGDQVFLGSNFVLEINSSVFQGGQGAFFVNGGTTVDNGILTLDPQFVDPDGVDNDLMTPGDNNFGLVSASSAIDAGNALDYPLDIYDLDTDADSAELLPVGDFLGIRRVIGAAIDLGAVEFCVLNIDGLGVVDAFDVAAFMNAVQASDPAADIDGNTTIDAADANAFLTGVANGDCAQE